MNKSDFFFDLPPELIAQSPLAQRDASRLLCLDKSRGTIYHRRFSNLTDILAPGDLLVLNDSRVIPARLLGHKTSSGAAIEFLLLEQKDQDTWEILVKPGKRALPGAVFTFGDGALSGEILEILDGGNRLARFSWQGDFFETLEKTGIMPLPHYISETLADPERYQTVYSRDAGSAAAPTAGLHFTPALLTRLNEKGINTAFVTLHVGLGTFRPVKSNDITEHKMHTERFTLPPATAQAVNRTKAAGGKVIAVGTTSCRTLESMAGNNGLISSGIGSTDIFIYPGHSFKVINGLITNFHLPESTLIMLVCAFAGYENTMNAYKKAIEEKYRFFSFGDAMLIL